MRADLRLVVPAAACWAVCGALIALPVVPGGLVVAAWALCVAVAAGVGATALLRRRTARRRTARRRAVRRDRLVRRRLFRLRARIARVRIGGMLCVSVAASALAVTAVAADAPARHPPAIAAATRGGRVVEAVLRVDSVPIRTAASGFAGAQKNRRQFRATMTTVIGAGREFTMSSPVLAFLPLTGSTEHEPLAIGSRLHVRGTLRSLQPAETTAFYFYGTAPPTRVVAPPWWLSWADTLRSGFSTAATALDGDGGDLLPGLAIGDVSAVGARLDTNMKASSLSHLTAVSGANCAVIIAVIMMAGGALGLRRGIRVAAALLALGGFVVLVTPGPSVLRAAVMAMIVVGSTAAGRPGRGMPALAMAVIALLVVDPWMARNYGFALSVLATAGLLLLAAPLGRALSRWMPRALGLVISIPLAAQLACQPVLILLSPTIPLFGVIANLLAEPAAPVATVIGLVSCLLLPWLPGLGVACAQIAWVPASWIAAVANTTASLPASRLPWFGGLLGAGAVVAVTALLLIVLIRPPGRLWRRVIAGVTVVLTVFCGAYGGGLIGGGVGRALAIPRDWQIAACDIGQGDAVLVRSGALHALVDVGPDPEPLTTCLDELGIGRIDLLVLTHYDLDHVGGLDAVIGRVGIALVGVPESDADRRRVAALRAGGADVRRASSGDHGTLGALDWGILWPQTGSTRMQTGNDGCVVIRFDGAGIRSVFLGDLGEDSQNALLATGRLSGVDVVKVAHHGSADQSEQLYRTLGARLGVISVGEGNPYGHPTDRLLSILARVGTVALRTDRDGMILIAPARGSPGGMVVWSERTDRKLG